MQPQAPPPPVVYRRDHGNAIVLAVVVPMAAVVVLAIAAAVAIPAFVKYQRRSKTVEPLTNVRKLAEASVSYYRLHHEVPPPSDWTPAGSPCLQPGMKFAPDPGAWRQPTWQALHFSVDHPHYYQYRVAVEGDDLLLQARGDLDCDEKFSLFERRERITALGLESDGRIFSRDDLE